MDLDGYERYLSLFNSKDYDGVLNHFTEDCEVDFAGYSFRGKNAVRDFYGFFHQKVREQIQVTRFLGDEDTIAIEVIVRLEGLKPFGAGELAERGLENLVPLEPGQVVELPQFIHYHLRGGKFQRAICLINSPPAKIVTA